MTSFNDLHYLELLDIARRIQAREISSVDATKAQLSRIQKLDSKLKSYATLMTDSALADASRADAEIAKGQIRGPMHGAPIAVKDLCWTQGVPTAAGMTIHANFKPDQDATVVKRLRGAGAVIMGKLQLTEGAYADHHPKIAVPVNPWNATHWSGASSSGSGVATAAGLCYGSLGSDTGGSIRFPAAANGLTGIKPTWGRVSRFGVFELAATLDHIGPMARSAADAAALLGAIAGADSNDPTAVQLPVPNYLAGMTRGLRGLRIGIDAAWNSTAVDAPTRAMMAEVTKVITEQGADIREVKFPNPEQEIADWFPLCGVETAVAHEATYPSRKSEYGPGLAGLIDLGLAQKRPGLSEDRVASAGVLGPRGRTVRGHRSVADPDDSRSVTHECAVGRFGQRCRVAFGAAALHLSVRHDGQPDDHAARWLHSAWHTDCLSIRGAAF